MQMQTYNVVISRVERVQQTRRAPTAPKDNQRLPAWVVRKLRPRCTILVGELYQKAPAPATSVKSVTLPVVTRRRCHFKNLGGGGGYKMSHVSLATDEVARTVELDSADAR